jgi:Holliday junction DNA helicase RuvA
MKDLADMPERLLLELKGKFGPTLEGVGGGVPTVDHAGDILRALLSLGYSEREATIAAKQLPPDASVSDGIKQALKLLARN